MPRKARVAPGGLVYHVLNRAAGRATLFRDDGDFAAFERVMLEAHRRVPGVRVLAYCVMSNHWHFAAWPTADGDLSAFFRWLANTHAVRWRAARRTVGLGPVYQGRFKSFPVQTDEHLLTACRYVERNPLTAGLVRRAQDWRWSSLWARAHGGDDLRAMLHDAWPAPRPADWTRLVNAPITRRELARLEASAARGRPFGDDDWVAHAVRRLGLEHTVRPEGRPKTRGPAGDAPTN